VDRKEAEPVCGFRGRHPFTGSREEDDSEELEQAKRQGSERLLGEQTRHLLFVERKHLVREREELRLDGQQILVMIDDDIRCNQIAEGAIQERRYPALIISSQLRYGEIDDASVAGCTGYIEERSSAST
jgi:hypothetical protein